MFFKNFLTGFLRARFTPYLLAVAILGTAVYVLFLSGVAWKAPVAGQQPAIRLSVHHDLRRIVLASEDDGEALGFAITDSAAGVKSFWLERHEKAGEAKPRLWQDCEEVPGAANPPSAQSPAPRAGTFVCKVDKEKRAIGEGASKSTFRKFLPKFKERKVVLTLGPPETLSRYRELWLIPYVRNKVADQDMINPASDLLWTEAEWDLGEKNSGVLKAKQCSSPDDEAEASCLFMQGLLDRPELVLIRDPQQLAVAMAQAMALRFVPFLVGVMVLVNVVLGAVFGAILVWWVLGRFRSDKGPRIGRIVFDAAVPRHEDEQAAASAAGAPAGDKQQGEEGKIPLLIPLDSVDRGFRRMLEWLEVTGPAAGFLLTVCALLLAFDPRIFVERDMNRFASAISMAMCATFAGLGIRILAFSCDRLLEQVLRRGGANFKVDLTDTVYQVPPQPKKGVVQSGSFTKPADTAQPAAAAPAREEGA